MTNIIILMKESLLVL